MNVAPAFTVADIVHASFPFGPADGEYRPETLQPGDSIRWMGRMHKITRGQITHENGVYLHLTAVTTGDTRVVLYRPGSWVHAVPIARPEAA